MSGVIAGRQDRFYQTNIARHRASRLLAAAACAQYPGQVAKKSKDTPDLRAIAVLEWTGDEGKPKTSRLVPITVYDGEALQDGNVYLARPQPMALAGEVEYELEKNGQPIGLYDIKNAGQEQGLWVGYGAWKPLPSAKAAGSQADRRRRLQPQRRQASPTSQAHGRIVQDWIGLRQRLRLIRQSGRARSRPSHVAQEDRHRRFQRLDHEPCF